MMNMHDNAFLGKPFALSKAGIRALLRVCRLLMVVAAFVQCQGPDEADEIEEPVTSDLASDPPPEEFPVEGDDSFESDDYGAFAAEPQVMQDSSDGMLAPPSPVYFELDKSDISPEGQEELGKLAMYLSSSTDTVLVEGHCDERGTVEYNLALGQRRAQAVKDFLVTLGVDAGRIETETKGEEEPAAPGTDEAAYSLNRRAEFIMKLAPAEPASGGEL